MECDSMHFYTIERKFKNSKIYTPAGYVSLIKSPKINPHPYVVK